ncbi:Phospholipase/carboxylesterase/thioesterase [Xylaria sp. CBS 124048]|nr:Phospholipase/carboxylesterase/thioesterase [Xylaria sp. CBS 124048]
MASTISRAKPLLFAASAKHTATVIFLHGLGDTGFGWASAVEGWIGRGKLDQVKWVLPHAPRMPITAAEGMSMPAWFNIITLTGPTEVLRANQDESGMLRTRDYIHTLIQEEIDAGIPSNRIVLGGFSQGGAMALFSGLTAKYKLGGILALSCWLPLDNTRFPALLQENNFNRQTPVLMAHGDDDAIIPLQRGQTSRDLLKSLDFDVTMKIYPNMPHSACQEELDDIESFLCKNLAEDGKTEL